MPGLEAAPIDNLPKQAEAETNEVPEVLAESTPASISNENEGYSYTRADGTVERASTPEDAMRRCPVLGKMPLEQANVLLEIAALGKEKLEQNEYPNLANIDTPKEKGIEKPKPKDDVPQLIVKREDTEPIVVESGRSIAQDILPDAQTDIFHAAKEKYKASQQRIHDTTSINVARLEEETNLRQAIDEFMPTSESTHTETEEVDIQPIPTVIGVTQPMYEFKETVTPAVLAHQPISKTAFMSLSVDLPERIELSEIEPMPETLTQEVAISDDQETLHMLNVIPDLDEQVIAETTLDQTIPNSTSIYRDLAPDESQAKHAEDTELPLDNFSSALETFLDNSIEAVEVNDKNEQESTAETMSELRDEIVPIVRLMANKIDALEVEESKVIAPLVEEITDLAINLHSLDNESVDSIQAAEERLETLCVQLFKHLDIDYDDKDIRLFIQFMAIELAMTPTENTIADLEHEGTREAKLKLAGLSHLVSDEKRQIKQMLGRFTLAYSQMLSTNRPRLSFAKAA